MRSYLTYYFAGVTTAGAAVVIGFGGALVFFNATLSTKPLPTRIERMAKSLPQGESLQTKQDFPAQAVPIVTTPQLPQIIEMPTIAATATEEPTQVAQPERSRPPTAAPTALEPKPSHFEQDAVTSSVKKVAAHPQKETAFAVAKRHGEFGTKNVHRAFRADSTRQASRQNREIAAAAEAVRRMIRDREAFSENAMEQSFNLGFSSD